MTKPRITYKVAIEPDYPYTIRGSFASGDNALDKQQEDEIRTRLRDGDTWAWCVTRVYAEVEDHDLTGVSSVLGGCSYLNEEDYVKNSGYYDDQCAEALKDLKEALLESINDAKLAVRILEELRED